MSNIIRSFEKHAPNQMEQLALIKGNAVNGGKARVCIQRTDLAKWGFEVGETIAIDYLPHGILITATDKGSRKVSKVTDNRRGVVYQTLDLRFPIAERENMFGLDSPKLVVYITNGLIYITKAKQGSY